MAKVFRFRLDRVLDLRRLHEKMKKKELAQVRAAVTRQQNDILQLLIRLDQGKGVSRDLRKDKIDMTSLRMQEQHLNGLMRSIRVGHQSLQERALDERKIQAELAEASKKVRVLERLREKKKVEYMRELGREEQKFLDEVAQNMTRLAAEKKESLR
jgi:flagellar FliJ protein